MTTTKASGNRLLVATLARKQNNLSEKACRVAIVRLVFSVPDGKRDSVVCSKLDPAGICRRRACSLHLVEGGVSSIAFDVGVKE